MHFYINIFIDIFKLNTLNLYMFNFLISLLSNRSLSSWPKQFDILHNLIYNLKKNTNKWTLYPHLLHSSFFFLSWTRKRSTMRTIQFFYYWFMLRFVSKRWFNSNWFRKHNINRTSRSQKTPSQSSTAQNMWQHKNFPINHIQARISYAYQRKNRIDSRTIYYRMFPVKFSRSTLWIFIWPRSRLSHLFRFISKFERGSSHFPVRLNYAILRCLINILRIRRNNWNGSA